MSQSESDSLFPDFDRDFLGSDEDFTVIGTGAIGGKAKGLAYIKSIISDGGDTSEFDEVTINIPRLTVIATDVFEQFMDQNELYEIALSDEPDDRIAHAFQQAELPTLILGDLRALISQIHTPLAIRSSSLLEDAMSHPFAGTYATKMIPNNQFDVKTRFQRLTEAVKYVYASTFFGDARRYMRAIGGDSKNERMAVIIQEVVGQRSEDRFYPTISGVLRTHNFYPTKPAKPEDGVVNLALGLGKTIVDGGVNWTYSPKFPRHSPPYGSVSDLLKNTQTRFWAVNMGSPPAYDPIDEAEYLLSCSLEEAENDQALRQIASTYDARSDRLTLGTGVDGPRVLNFAPILDLADVPLNKIVQSLSKRCKEAVKTDVEIEFAMTLDPNRGLPARFGFLQMRPMLVADEAVALSEDMLVSPEAIVATNKVMGNGELDEIADIVYVKPDVFEARHTPAIAGEVELINRELATSKRSYVLLGFGRWGSSDPWLGIPVTWPQISSARVIVEATLPDMDVEPSQGSHFFHNITSFRICYLTVSHNGPHAIDWNYLATLPAERELEFVRHARLPSPLRILVDGRAGRGVILRNPG